MRIALLADAHVIGMQRTTWRDDRIIMFELKTNSALQFFPNPLPTAVGNEELQAGADALVSQFI